jgi:hypothetical protein
MRQPHGAEVKIIMAINITKIYCAIISVLVILTPSSIAQHHKN